MESNLEKSLTADDFQLEAVVAKGFSVKLMLVKKKDTGKPYLLQVVNMKAIQSTGKQETPIKTLKQVLVVDFIILFNHVSPIAT